MRLQAAFSPSVDLVSHESVQARQMPSSYLEAGHFGGLRQSRASPLMEEPGRIRRPITQPCGPVAICADAKTQTVCEASAQVCIKTCAIGVFYTWPWHCEGCALKRLRVGMTLTASGWHIDSHGTPQTEDDNSGPPPERVIRIPSGARPSACTPVIVPVKSSRKDARGGKASHKRTVKVKQKARQAPDMQNTPMVRRSCCRTPSLTRPKCRLFSQHSHMPRCVLESACLCKAQLLMPRFGSESLCRFAICNAMIRRMLSNHVPAE